VGGTDESGTLNELSLQCVVEAETPTSGWRLRSFFVEEAAALWRHAVAVAALEEDTLDVLCGCDESGDFLELSVDELSPGLFRASAFRRRNQSPDIAEAHPEAAAEANEHQAVDRIGSVRTLAPDPRGFWKDAGVFVVADRGSAQTRRGGKLSDAQGGGRDRFRIQA